MRRRCPSAAWQTSLGWQPPTEPGTCVEATRQLAGPGINDPLAVVVITTFDTDENVSRALKAGARGFLLKDAGPDLLVQAIHAAANGDALIAPSITARLLARVADSATSSQPAQPLHALTEREEEVALASTTLNTHALTGYRLEMTQARPSVAEPHR